MNNQKLEKNLESLGRSLPESGDFVSTVMSRLAVETVEPVRTHSYARWIMKTSIGLAAGTLLGVALWAFLPPSRASYAFADMPQRLRSVENLHLKGILYNYDGGQKGYPIEFFLQRPDRYRINGTRAFTQNGVEEHDVIATSDHIVYVDDTHKSVVVSATTAVDQRVDFEQIFQMEVVSLMLGPSQGNDFKNIRTEPLGGISADLYEAVHTEQNVTDRSDVWLDPATGLPLQARFFIKFGNKAERLTEEIDTIDAVTPIPAETFDFKPPIGYAVSHLDQPATLESGGVDHISVEVRFVFNLDNRGILICWRVFDPRDPTRLFDPVKDRVAVTFRSGRGVDYAEQILHSDPVPQGPPWRWSLLIPSKPIDSTDGDLNLTARSASRSQLSLGFRPVQFDALEQKTLIEQAQSLTLPPGSTPVPLDQLRDQLAR
jgi:outer membrane lipoprotein-sorting protein